MAYEKIWHYRHNVIVDGADDEETAQNWMWQLHQFLSGGAEPGGGVGSNVGKWEILSESNSVTDGPAGVITGPSSFTWDVSDSAHSWFLARKNLFPTSSALPDGSNHLYLTVDCNNADDTFASFVFNYQPPTSEGDINNRPTEDVEAYIKSQAYRYVYDAANISYFHGIMDETGSFVLFSSRNAPGNYNYPFTLAALRLENPRSPEIDPYQVMIKCCYDDRSTYHGPWGNVGYSSRTSRGNTDYWNGGSNWSTGGADASAAMGGQAMWSYLGAADSGYGNYAAIMTLQSSFSYGRGPQQQIDPEGSDIDGTYPRLPLLVWEDRGSTAIEMRGRIPDLTTGAGRDVIDGATVPADVGVVTACQIGDYFFPATASLLPGA